MRIGDPKSHAVDMIQKEVAKLETERTALIALIEREQRLVKVLDEKIVGAYEAINVLNRHSNGGYVVK